MKSFKEYLTERVLSIGLNAAHDHLREKHRQEIHDMLHHAYKKIGGYAGHESGSKEESDAIHHDISHSYIKATRRGEKLSTVNLYKNQHGRKSIASATDTSDQGKSDFVKNKEEDNSQKRAWGEVSGAVEKIHNRIGTPKIPSSRAKELLGKDVTPSDNGTHYTRKIGGHDHEKVMVGHPKVQ